MSRHMKLIVFDIAMAVAIVILYSPGLLNLRPTDSDILRAGCSIIFGVIIVAAIVWYNFSVLHEPGYEHVSTSGQVDHEGLVSVLERYRDVPVVGAYAASAMSELDQMRRKRERLSDVISGKFTRNSITWDKFIAIVDSAEQTVNKNAALLANRVQSFDADDYRATKQLMESGAYRHDEIPDELQLEKWSLMQGALSDMRNIVESNERLLLELDKFAVELGQLDASENSEGNARMLDEIRNLIEATKYYR